MSASLVGSEMCIRDSRRPPDVGPHPCSTERRAPYPTLVYGVLFSIAETPAPQGRCGVTLVCARA
eukprot:9333554-Alexandrium_andersonii.AAC.1